jgi:signal transduction histidine kinase
MGKGFAGRIAAERRPMVVDDVDDSDVLNPILREKGIKSLLGVPLIVRGDVIGVMHVGTLQPRAFDDDDVELLLLAGERAALAIAHGRMFEAERAAANRLRKLQSVTDAALVHLDLGDLLEELLDRVRDALGADTCAILLLDEEANELEARAARGIEEEVERGVRIPVGRGFAGRVAAERRPVVIDDVDTADIYNPILREKGIKSLLGAPLISHDKLLGVIHVGTLTPRVFTEDDEELLTVVAQRVAMAIDRALAHDEVVRLTELQGSFLQLAAHELRTPATTVYGLAATINARRDQLDRETLWQLLGTLHEQAERMRRLVDQLLDLSRIEAAFVAIDPERVELRPLVEEVVRAVAPGADVAIDVPPGITATVDPNAFERVVGNLLTNAIRYGSPPVHITASDSDRHLRVSVEDRGEGIADEFVPFLFERFRRSDESRTSIRGTGLGLSIARAYARAHGGDLLYHPAEPHGARFELVLPRA